jgi:hypothetical protein
MSATPQAPLTRQQYRSAASYALFIYWVLTLFSGSKHPFDFFPYGLLVLCLLVFCGFILACAHSRKAFMTWEFRAITGCCIIFTGYAISEAVVHFVNGQAICSIRPLAAVVLVFTFWLGEKWHYWF